MNIINGLHGVGIALAMAAIVTLVTLFLATAVNEEAPPHAAKLITAALSTGIIASFLIGATS